MPDISNKKRPAKIIIANKIFLVEIDFSKYCFAGDYSTTRIINDMKRVGSSIEDLVAFLTGINLPADETTKEYLAKQILETEIKNGCLTISNALQWRLSYSWICPNRDGKTKPLNNLDGVHNILHKITEQ